MLVWGGGGITRLSWVRAHEYMFIWSSFYGGESAMRELNISCALWVLCAECFLCIWLAVCLYELGATCVGRAWLDGFML